jgi:hypothetical protein
LILGPSRQLQLIGLNGGTIKSFAGANNPLIIQTTANNNNIVNTPNGTGNVGIGTTTPTEKLNVNGGLLVNGAPRWPHLVRRSR